MKMGLGMDAGKKDIADRETRITERLKNEDSL
jgi:hypothetical protein